MFCPKGRWPVALRKRSATQPRATAASSTSLRPPAGPNHAGESPAGHAMVRRFDDAQLTWSSSAPEIASVMHVRARDRRREGDGGDHGAQPGTASVTVMDP
jgi:alkanesulfonate monooxygenase SsuD/methylene tetrahydromethanopterin reductase-like flavin-dependent oxidoreductase (luciferase family)